MTTAAPGIDEKIDIEIFAANFEEPVLPCDYDGCEKNGEWMLICGACGSMETMCTPHKADTVERPEMVIYFSTTCKHRIRVRDCFVEKI